MEPVGISDIALYIPKPRISLNDIVEKRGGESPRMKRRFLRALDTTGQQFIRFPEGWEDPMTFAAETARALFLGPGKPDPEQVRYLVAGTETSLDSSKPLSAYVQGMLRKAGIAIAENLTSFQVQHACAGGTLALFSIIAMIQATGKPDETGIVLSSDIARYRTATTAEITQGAGAVGVLAELNPKLVEIDIPTTGFYSNDVDDFFRPLGQDTAEVKGGYSVQCYHKALQSSFEDYCKRAGITEKDALENTDIFVLHTPFRNMPEAGMIMLYEKYAKYDAETARKTLASKLFYKGIDPIAQIGNIYTGSILFTLAFSLKAMYERDGKAMEGKRVLLASYGSGNTMAMMPGRICTGASEIVKTWNLDTILSETVDSSFASYEQWIAREKHGLNGYDPSHIGKNRFFLENIREDGYREYSISGTT